jgi:hypothetical protein
VTANFSGANAAAKMGDILMRALVVSALAAVAALATGTASFAEVKKVPYTQVKVEVPDAVPPDAARETMRKAFVDAVAKKDSNALFALVGPTFVWLSQNTPNEQFDMGRDALHNFKVAFGFREYGKDSDGNVADGPFWDALASYANDDTYYQDIGTLICGPISASFQDEEALEKAKQKIGADDSVEWYFTTAETTATAGPGTGAPVGKVAKVALPILRSHPPAKEGQPEPTATHFEVLLPSGKSGWIAASAPRPFANETLCYAPTSKGEWKIVAFDQGAAESE